MARRRFVTIVILVAAQLHCSSTRTVKTDAEASDSAPLDGAAADRTGDRHPADGPDANTFRRFVFVRSYHCRQGGCSNEMELEATGALTVTHSAGQSPDVVHTAKLTSEDLNRAIKTLTDPALLEILFSDTPCCDGVVLDYGERLTIDIGGRQGTIDYSCICDQASVEAARQEMDRLVEKYVVDQ